MSESFDAVDDLAGGALADDVLADEVAEAEASAETVRTGDPTVDAVLDQLTDVEGTPVDEHVAVFERAHEQLRRALDAPSDTRS